MAAISALCLGAQAHAANVTVTYTGVVNATQIAVNGAIEPTIDIDAADLFGGGNLEGYDFTAVVTYNTALGLETTDGQTFDERDGGASFYDYSAGIYPASPITGETFTINNDSYAFTPDYYADVTTQVALPATSSSPASSGFIQQTAVDTAGDNAILNYVTDAAPASLSRSFSSDTGAGGGYLLTPFVTVGGNTVSDAISLDTVTVTVSATPEPASWALMIAGVALTGVALRYGRSRSLKTATAAV